MTAEIYKKTKSWPFIEAYRILERIGGKVPEKGYVLFETGYGPSGLPHIGTFGEVVRTCFVKHAFEVIAPEISTKLVCVSDDIDGFRKVPDNIPKQELMTKNLGKPLTSVPDPFETHASYGDNMNARLQAFLDSFGFDYEFISATKKYQSGEFDETMLAVLDKYEELMELMLPTLGGERQKTYSPFMPIDPESGKVIDKGVKGIDKASKEVIYNDENGVEKRAKVTGGNCKLQWKIDFGARWKSLDVNYEIYGKDHQPNERIYQSVCKILGGIPPVNYVYEMFLSDSGEKISKSKGNGISVEDWLKYAPSESMSLFMYQKPRTAKRLYFDVIPKAMDEYLSFVAAFHEQEDEAKKIENPVYHIHAGQVPKVDFDLSFALLLNLAVACNPDNDDVLWGYISQHKQGLTKDTSPLLNKMVHCAINYYNDFIKATKKFRAATQEEKTALQELSEKLSTMKDEKDGAALQKVIYEVGRNHGFEDKMRDWFCALYQILLGQDKGPRMGSFVALYGVENFVSLIKSRT